MPPSRAAALLGLAACLAGCAGVAERVPGMRMGAQAIGATEDDLHSALGVWAVSFASLVGVTADQIRAESRDRAVRRNAVLWQLHMIPLARLAAFRPDAKTAYVASLALSVAQREYLTTGEGRELFGDRQSIAADAASRLEQEVVDLGRVFLSDRQLARLRKQVDEVITQHPIEGTFASEALIHAFADPKQQQTFSWVTDLPMTPFRALSGVSDTAQAVQNFNETAREFTAVVNQLPQQSRWQAELLLYDAEELESVERALSAAESVAVGAQGISGAATALPEELGAEMAAQLHEAKAALAELDSALARAQALGEPLSRVADRVGEASAQWTALLAEMRADDRAAGDSGRPFDVREYESAAVRIADASRGLRELVAAINGLDVSGAAAILDRATWRAALLIVVFFAALAAYRVLASRLRD
ncbi:MAG TPA: hypothetical protein VKH41_01585 [Myxococcota bacterium]|nr:hypothetical protein [Myxococcota bacterium]